MFPQNHRLRHDRDINFVRRRGQRIPSRNFVIWFGPSPSPVFRATVIAGKKVEKSAVRRNRVKRLLREALRRNILENFPNFPAVDLVLWVRHERTLPDFDFHKIFAEIQTALQKLSAIAAQPGFGQIKPQKF